VTRIEDFPAALLIGISMTMVGCHAKEDHFYGQVFACAASVAGGACGTGRDGRQMVCYPGSQLGTTDFCAESCPDTQPGSSGSQGFSCLGSGASLKVCRPSAPAGDTSFGCPGGFECYRTDLARDEGLCMPLHVCSKNDDCSDPARSTCLGTLVRQMYPHSNFSSDHLQCLPGSCRTSLSACPPGSSCLASLVSTTGVVPDICVPNCDSHLNCPPNFICIRRTSPGAPAICVPGLPGYKCMSALDCVTGECLDTGEGFSVCSVQCEKDADCLRYNEPNGSFSCVKRSTDGLRYCATPSTFSGSGCAQSSDCPAGQRCFPYNPYRQVPYGECRPPCDAEGRCPARGGIPHVCLRGNEGGCYPGRFGLPCAHPGECVADFSCEAVTPAPGETDSATRICTIPCQTDADCDADPWTDQDGFCQDGFCRLGNGPGGPCERDAHCRTRNCQRGDAGTGTCVLERPG
jgi:hypothetical protein